MTIPEATARYGRAMGQGGEDRSTQAMKIVDPEEIKGFRGTSRARILRLFTRG